MHKYVSVVVIITTQRPYAFHHICFLTIHVSISRALFIYTGVGKQHICGAGCRELMN